MPPARKGDLAIVKRRRSYTGSAGHVETHTYEVGRVRKTTRLGDITEVDLVGLSGTTDIARRTDYNWVQVLTEPASRVDVDAVMSDARKHHFAGHPNHPKPFDDLSDIIEIAKRHRKPHLINR